MAVLQNKYPNEIPSERPAITEWKKKTAKFLRETDALCECDEGNFDIVHPETRTGIGNEVRVTCKGCDKKDRFDLNDLDKRMKEHNG